MQCFSKNRHDRFQQARVLQELFERIVEQCMAVGLVQGSRCRWIGSFIQANAITTAAFRASADCRVAQVAPTVGANLGYHPLLACA